MEFEQVYDLYFRDVYRYILKLSGLRKEKHTTPLEELPESVGSADTPEELIGAREEARQIQAILHDLPEPYREVFMWSCLISRSVNCSPSRITGYVSPTTVPET